MSMEVNRGSVYVMHETQHPVSTHVEEWASGNQSLLSGPACMEGSPAPPIPMDAG